MKLRPCSNPSHLCTVSQFSTYQQISAINYKKKQGRNQPQTACVCDYNRQCTNARQEFDMGINRDSLCSASDDTFCTQAFFSIKGGLGSLLSSKSKTGLYYLSFWTAQNCYTAANFFFLSLEHLLQSSPELPRNFSKVFWRGK